MSIPQYLVTCFTIISFACFYLLNGYENSLKLKESLYAVLI